MPWKNFIFLSPEYVTDAGVDFSAGKQAVEQLLKQQHIAFDAPFLFLRKSLLPEQKQSSKAWSPNT